jgi:uncharacterized RDD family membrane protein YckC
VSTIEPGWYKDPADPATQRYWDGEGWLGDPVAADATPPDGPPPPKLETPAVPAVIPAPVQAAAPVPAPPIAIPPVGAPPPGWVPPAGWAPPPGWAPPGYVAVLEPRPHGLMLAGAGSRLVARIVDILAVLLLCVIANFWFAVEFWRDVRPFIDAAMRLEPDAQALPPVPESANILLIVMSVVACAVWFAYEVPASANSGQTLGKRLLGIKVVRLESEDRLGFGRSFRRWMRLGLPTLFWAACAGLTFLLQVIDCLFVVIDKPLRQALHDKSAATVVIQVPRPSRPETAQRTTPERESVTTGGRNADPR